MSSPLTGKADPVQPALGSFVSYGITDLREIARGASSTVFAGVQDQYGRTVAVKIFTTQMKGEKSRRRFDRECRTLGRLAVHPSVVNLYGSGFDSSERPFMVMDLCEQGSLQDRLVADGPFSAESVLRIGIKIASALEFAHASGVLHRDIKPANVLVTSFGEPALSDFGISAEASTGLSWTVGESLTPLYAAPEVLENGGGTVASDIWSLSGTLYALLLGRAPYADTTSGLLAVVNRIIHDPPPPIDRDDVPLPLTELLAAGMAKHAADRPSSAAEFAATLQQVQREAGLTVTEYLNFRPAAPVAESKAALARDEEAGVDVDVDEASPVGDDGVPSRSVAPSTVRRAPRGLDVSEGVGLERSSAPDAFRRGPVGVEPVVVAPAIEKSTVIRRHAADRPSLGGAAERPEKQPDRWWRPPVLIGAALVAVFAVALGLVIAIGRGSGSPQTPGAPDRPIALPSASFTTSCRGLACTFTVAKDSLPAGAVVRFLFPGFKTPELASSGVLEHRFALDGPFTYAAQVVDGTRTGAMTHNTAGIMSFTRTLSFEGSKIVGRPVELRIHSSHKSCLAGVVHLERLVKAHKPLNAGNSRVARDGTATIRVDKPGEYRAIVLKAPVSTGVCGPANATRKLLPTPRVSSNPPTTQTSPPATTIGPTTVSPTKTSGKGTGGAKPTI